MDIKEVENMAELARIELSEDEKKELLSEMESILGYVKQVERPTVDVEEVEASPKETHNIWREDEIIPREFSRELIIEQFPDSQDGFLKVKKIL